MRDIGLFIWVGILILGVVSSISKSAKRQQQAAQQAQGRPAGAGLPPPPPAAPAPAAQLIAPGSSPQQATLLRVMQAVAAQQGLSPAPPRPERPAPKAVPPPAAALRPPPPVHPPLDLPQQAKRRLFASQPELVRAVIAAEVLGKPKAFNDEYRL
ncbi:MAG TPA: hypothetical protein VHS56_03410 [Candidatus Cybelea sp.]|jgi:hypothetical protein|nr:hypothetical protein [Candidatus Cybelea sp.]